MNTMQSLTDRKKVVSKKEMTFMEKLYLPAIIGGMWITFKHLFRKNNTVKYPEETREFAPVYRGQHVLKRDEEGRENCTACGLCAVACPAEAITMVAAERVKGEENLYREENTLRNTKSICCVVSSVDCVKKHVQKKQSS
jgi:NADH-quinone oxidoreductase subunit I